MSAAAVCLEIRSSRWGVLEYVRCGVKARRDINSIQLEQAAIPPLQSVLNPQHRFGGDHTSSLDFVCRRELDISTASGFLLSRLGLF